MEMNFIETLKKKVLIGDGAMGTLLLARGIKPQQSFETLCLTEPVIIKAVDLGATRIIEKTVETIPKEYVVVRQDDINQSVMKVTQAYSEGRLTSTDIQDMGREVFQLVADQEITSEEIDRMIKLIDRIVE